jgi:hypothetical protein
MSSDLTGVNPATLNGILLYYRLMTKRSGLGDIAELSRMGLSQHRLNGASRGDKVHNHTRTHRSEGATEPSRDEPGPVGPSRPAWPTPRLGWGLLYNYRKVDKHVNYKTHEGPK